MKNMLKRLLLCIPAATLACCAFGDGSDCERKGALTWFSVESPPTLWTRGYGDDFPADYTFKAIAEAGFTGVEFEVSGDRGPSCMYFNTATPGAKRCERMGRREWLEEALTAADNYGLALWVILTPDAKVEGTDIKGLDDPRHIQIWTSLVAELGSKYKPRHKSLAGIYLHEFDCAEAPDLHQDDLDKFAAFCESRFGERFEDAKIPDGLSGTKWDRRYWLYKNDIMTSFVKALSSEAAKHGMKSMFCLYPPEMNDGCSAAWGYDAVAIEKSVDAFWVVVQSEYRGLKNAWMDTGCSYSGINVPVYETMAVHGNPTSLFECRMALFPDVVRRYYSKHGEFTKVYGDFFNGFLQKSEKTMQLFTGSENVRKWNSLQREWMGAEPQAKIAVMAASVPFVIRFPSAPGTVYKRCFRSVLDALEKRYPADAQLTGSEFMAKPGNLQRYDLIVVPEEMGVGMDEASLNSLKAYLANGGKILAIGSQMSSGSADLEVRKSCMEELFGVKVADAKPLPGYTVFESKALQIPDKRIWCEMRDVEILPGTEVLVSDKFAGKPVLTRKGGAYFLACDFNEAKTPLLYSIIDKAAPQAARLDGDGNFKIASMLKKGDVLCMALPSEKAAAATLSVDAKRLGVKAGRLEVRDIVLGRTVAKVSPEELKKGVKIGVAYDSEPYVLAIGPEKEIARYDGMYADEKMFADMGRIALVENPEVAIAVPDRPGVKVGIYQNAYGADVIYEQLRHMPEFNCFYLPRLDGECMAHADVIVIPQARNDAFFNCGANALKDLVRNGKGVLLTHESASKASELFPDVASESRGKIMLLNGDKVKTVDSLSPNGAKAGEEYAPGFAFDHYALAPGKDGKSIAKDSKGNDVMVAGKFEKGRVVLFGTLPGAFSKWDNPELLNNGKLEGTESQLLVDSVRWLAGEKTK